MSSFSSISPDLIFTFVFEARVFGVLDLDLHFVQLAGHPVGSLSRASEAAAEILLDEICYVCVDDSCGQLRIGRRKGYVQ